MITADLRLEAIPDPTYPWQTVNADYYGELHKAGEERTRFCSIELLSYSFSEMYILRGEAGSNS